MCVIVAALLCGLASVGFFKIHRSWVAEGRCTEACAPRRFEGVVRGSACLCIGSNEVVSMKEPK